MQSLQAANCRGGTSTSTGTGICWQQCSSPARPRKRSSAPTRAGLPLLEVATTVVPAASTASAHSGQTARTAVLGRLHLLLCLRRRGRRALHHRRPRLPRRRRRLRHGGHQALHRRRRRPRPAPIRAGLPLMETATTVVPAASGAPAHTGQTARTAVLGRLHHPRRPRRLRSAPTRAALPLMEAATTVVPAASGASAHTGQTARTAVRRRRLRVLAAWSWVGPSSHSWVWAC